MRAMDRKRPIGVDRTMKLFMIPITFLLIRCDFFVMNSRSCLLSTPGLCAVQDTVPVSISSQSGIDMLPYASALNRHFLR